ncbi:MAG: hypothetical protein IKC22_00645 [Bacilli bacterium]|nr:hypothetical protein [bacterium]MBR2890890.1 hypothetical protein [Bacilli bacterium]
MEEKFKETNTYNFFKDLIYDITEDYRTNENKEYDFDKTIDNLMEDDEFWQELTNAVWNNLVEIEKESK